MNNNYPSNLKRTFQLLLVLFLTARTFVAGAQSVCYDHPMEGYATVAGDGISTTTGGTGGPVTVVTNLAGLQEWAKGREKSTSPAILHISGKISTTDAANSLITIKNGANISIYGINEGELQGIGLNIRDYNNVIVRNLKIHEVLYPNDGLTLDNVSHAWVDHNEFYSINGPGIGVDTYDGLFDIKKGSRYITVSWNSFHDHKKVLLIGHTDNSGALAEDSKFTVTIHHNYFYNNDGRNPSLRFGNVHLYNNYFKIIYDYGIAVRQGAHALIEGNVYEDVVTPVSTDKFDGPEGFACLRGNIFSNTGSSSVTQTGCSWWNNTTLPYSYALDSAVNVPEKVIREAALCMNNADPVPTLPINIITAMEEQGENKKTFVLQSITSEFFILRTTAPVQIEVFNLSGKSMDQFTVDKEAYFGKNYPKGTYISRLIMADKTEVQRIVKE